MRLLGSQEGDFYNDEGKAKSLQLHLRSLPSSSVTSLIDKVPGHQIVTDQVYDELSKKPTIR